MSTLAQLEASLRDKTGLFDPDLFPTSTAYEYLNETYLQLCGDRHWPFLRGRNELSLPAGDTTLLLPVDLRDLLSVQVSEGSANTPPLVPAFVAPSEALHWTTDVEGEPQEYTVESGSIRFYPAPSTNRTVVMTYMRTAAPLVQPTDTPLFEAEFHPAIAYGAAAQVLAVREGEDGNRASSAQAVFERYWKRMEERYFRNRNQVAFQYGARRSSGRVL